MLWSGASWTQRNMECRSHGLVYLLSESGLVISPNPLNSLPPFVGYLLWKASSMWMTTAQPVTALQASASQLRLPRRRTSTGRNWTRFSWLLMLAAVRSLPFPWWGVVLVLPRVVEGPAILKNCKTNNAPTSLNHELNHLCTSGQEDIGFASLIGTRRCLRLLLSRASRESSLIG